MANGVVFDMWVNEEPYFPLRKNNIRYIIRLKEMVYAESCKRTLHIHMLDGSVFEISQKPIEYIIGLAGSKELFRCSRGILVNRRYINEVDITNKRIRLENGTMLKIGMSYIESVKTLYECIWNDI